MILDASSPEEEVTVKNSFIHLGDRPIGSSQGRRSSAPVIVRASEYMRPIMADHPMTSPPPAAIAFSGEIFY